MTLNSVENKDVGILGLAFKPNTNSVAGSSAIRLAETLVAKGARVRAYDPVALSDAKTRLNGSVRYCESAYAAAEGMDAFVVGTGWPEFRALDFDRIKHLLKKPIIVDTKNLLDSARLRAMGFEYVGVAQGIVRSSGQCGSRAGRRILSGDFSIFLFSSRNSRGPAFSFAFFYLILLVSHSLCSYVHLVSSLIDDDLVSLKVEDITACVPRRAFLTSPNRSCYNQRGGGNSSTGRAPDCGSDGCGFDSRFPPQKFLLNRHWQKFFRRCLAGLECGIQRQAK